MPRALSIERRETAVFSIIVLAATLISLIMTMKMAPSRSVFPDVFAFVAAADFATSGNPMSVYDQEIMKKAQALLGGGDSFYPYAYNAAATLFLSLIYLTIPVPVMFEFAIFGIVVWSGSIFVRLTGSAGGASVEPLGKVCIARVSSVSSGKNDACFMLALFLMDLEKFHLQLMVWP